MKGSWKGQEQMFLLTSRNSLQQFTLIKLVFSSRTAKQGEEGQGGDDKGDKVDDKGSVGVSGVFSVIVLM
jgi:hypothetical protein